MAPSLRLNPRKTPKALVATSSSIEKEQIEIGKMSVHVTPKTLMAKTVSPSASARATSVSIAEKNTFDGGGAGNKVGSNLKMAARTDSDGEKTPSKRTWESPALQDLTAKRQKTTNHESASRQPLRAEKKDAKTIANALQAALMKERIRSGQDLDESYGKNDPMALIEDLQAAIMEETIQHRMELEDGTNRLAKIDQYKRRAHEAEDRLKVKAEEANQAKDQLEQMKLEMANVLDENGELERRLSGIIAMATGEQQPQDEDIEEVPAAAAVTPTPKREPRARWHPDEMMPLYRLCHTIGSNPSDWEKIAATGEIPNKSAQQMSSKWHTSNKTAYYNPLEKAFCEAKAKVAKQKASVKFVGNVTDYVMDEKTREGTWTVVWGDGTAAAIKKDELFAALDLYDGMKKEAKHEEKE